MAVTKRVVMAAASKAAKAVHAANKAIVTEAKKERAAARAVEALATDEALMSAAYKSVRPANLSRDVDAIEFGSQRHANVYGALYRRGLALGESPSALMRMGAYGSDRYEDMIEAWKRAKVRHAMRIEARRDAREAVSEKEAEIADFVRANRGRFQNATDTVLAADKVTSKILAPIRHSRFGPITAAEAHAKFMPFKARMDRDIAAIMRAAYGGRLPLTQVIERLKDIWQLYGQIELDMTGHKTPGQYIVTNEFAKQFALLAEIERKAAAALNRAAAAKAHAKNARKPVKKAAPRTPKRKQAGKITKRTKPKAKPKAKAKAKAKAKPKTNRRAAKRAGAETPTYAVWHPSS
jgi:hypothetical protein